MYGEFEAVIVLGRFNEIHCSLYFKVLMKYSLFKLGFSTVPC